MDLSSLRSRFKPGVKITFYVDFDALTAQEKNDMRELISKTGANFRFDKEYSLFGIAIALPFMSKEQYEILRKV